MRKHTNIPAKARKGFNRQLTAFIWVFMVSISILSGVAQAEICVDSTTAGKMLVEIEQSRVSTDICRIKDEQIQVLQAQVAELKRITDIKNDLLAIKDGAITSLNGLIERQRDDCNRMLKESKPSIIKQIFSLVGATGLGVIIALIAL
jgi:hypothetical protein